MFVRIASRLILQEATGVARAIQEAKKFLAT
jgi:hypothetical protein